MGGFQSQEWTVQTSLCSDFLSAVKAPLFTFLFGFHVYGCEPQFGVMELRPPSKAKEQHV